MHQGETVAARITGEGRSAIAIVDVHGPAAHGAVLRYFAPATPAGPVLERDRIRYGRWHSGETLVVVATGSESVQIHCHGGRAAIASILEDLQQAGVSVLSWQDLRRRQGVSDEAIALERLVCGTNTLRTAAIALDQQRGAMRQWVTDLSRTLAPHADNAPVPNAVRESIAEVLRREPLGRHLVDPWKVVVAGPPNVGKSSLMNALLGYQRAITFDAPGTTRDVLHAETAIEGWPVRLSDTAGVRPTPESIEAEGVRRATKALAEADLVVMVVDASQGPDATHEAIVARTPGPLLCVWNKWDLVAASPPSPREPYVVVSATRGEGVAELLQAIASHLVPEPPPPGAPVPVTTDQLAMLRRALEARTIEQCRQALQQPSRIR